MKAKRSLPWVLLVATSGLMAGPTEAGRGVARVGLLNGDVTMRRGDSGDWIAAAVNAPLVTGDRLTTARASRAEIQFDYSNFLRLAENSEVRLADLEGRRYQIQLSRGVFTYRVLKGSTSEVEINTPALAVRPLKRGIYRIQVLENGESEITVRDGEAEIHSGQGSETLREGRTMVARLGPADRAVEVQVARASAEDEWDRWNERRDRYLLRSRSHDYVHSSVYGVEDLDDHGYWHHIDGYGPSWFPRVAVGWAPYRYGRWAWIDWYGWSWLSYDPWGWAPFHYGRWHHHHRYGWGWYPGPRVYSYWSPALVGFFGWGRRSGFGVGIGFGYDNIGWVPLAPGEAYYPWYGRGYYGRGRSNVYVDNSVRVTNVTNITNVYRNARVNGGLVSVGVEDFARGRVGNPARVNVAEVRNAGQIRGLIPVVPERDSLRVADRDVARSSAGRSAESPDRFFTRREPAALERVPFSEQQQQISRVLRAGGAGNPRAEGETPAATGGAEGPRSIRSLDGGERNPGSRRADRAPEPGITNTPAAGATTSPPLSSDRNVERNSGWRRFGDDRRTTPDPGGRRVNDEGRAVPPAATTSPPLSSDRNVERNSGWRRFGDERRASPAAGAPPPPAPADRNTDRAPRDSEVRPSSSWRRFGQLDRDAEPVEPRRSIRGLGESRGESRQESPRFERRGAEVERNDSSDGGRVRGMGNSGEIHRRSAPGGENHDRGGRQLEINRPILMERSSPRGDSGRSAPAPSAAPRDGGGGSRGRR